jgi:hypothetical protein
MGKHLTIEQVQASMKQTVLAPNSFFELIDSAEIFGKVLSIVYTAQTANSQSAGTLQSAKLRDARFRLNNWALQTRRFSPRSFTEWIYSAKNSPTTA